MRRGEETQRGDGSDCAERRLPVRAEPLLQPAERECRDDRADADRGHELAIDLGSIVALTAGHERQKSEISAGEGEEGDGADERCVHFAAVTNIAHARRHCADQAFGRQRFLLLWRRSPPDQGRKQRQTAAAAAPKGNSDTELRNGVSRDRWTDRARDVVASGVDCDGAVEDSRSHEKRVDEQPCRRRKRAGRAHQERCREQCGRTRQPSRHGGREGDRNRHREVCVTIRSRRGSTTSVSAPAGRVRRKSGRVVATWTAETSLGLGLRLVIIQAEPVSNIAKPTLDSEVATKMTIKAGLLRRPEGRSGFDGVSGSPFSSGSSSLPPGS